MDGERDKHSCQHEDEHSEETKCGIDLILGRLQRLGWTVLCQRSAALVLASRMDSGMALNRSTSARRVFMPLLWLLNLVWHDWQSESCNDLQPQGILGFDWLTGLATREKLKFIYYFTYRHIMQESEKNVEKNRSFS